MRSCVVAFVALVVWHVIPNEAVAQRPGGRAQLETLGLETGQVGRVVYFYAAPVLSLDCHFMNALRGPEVARVYGWYQFLLNTQAAALYDRHGLALLPRLKGMLPWERAPGWTAAGLLRDLHTVTPKLAEWAESFGEIGPGG